MCLYVVVQRKEHNRPSASLNTASARPPQQPLESKLNWLHKFLCIVFVLSMLLVNAPWIWLCGDVNYVEAVGWVGGSQIAVFAFVCACGEGHNVRQMLNMCVLQQSMFRSNCLAAVRHVRGLALNQLTCLGNFISASVGC
jgi:hypothetical protein